MKHIILTFLLCSISPLLAKYQESKRLDTQLQPPHPFQVSYAEIFLDISFTNKETKIDTIWIDKIMRLRTICSLPLINGKIVLKTINSFDIKYDLTIELYENGVHTYTFHCKELSNVFTTKKKPPVIVPLKERDHCKVKHDTLAYLRNIHRKM